MADEYELDFARLMTASEAAQVLSDVKVTGIRRPLAEWIAMMGVASDGRPAFPFDATGHYPQASQVARYGGRPNPFLLSTTDPARAQSAPRIGIGMATLAGGSVADVEVVAALSGYSPIIELLGVISDTADTYQLAFQDSDNAAASGLIGGIANVTCEASIYNQTLRGAHIYGTLSKALEVDISGGAGAEKVTLDYLFWYEHA